MFGFVFFPQGSVPLFVLCFFNITTIENWDIILYSYKLKSVLQKKTPSPQSNINPESNTDVPHHCILKINLSMIHLVQPTVSSLTGFTSLLHAPMPLRDRPQQDCQPTGTGRGVSWTALSRAGGGSHRCTDWWGWKGSLGITQSNSLLQHSAQDDNQDLSRARDSTASLGSVGQGSTTLTARNFFFPFR